MRAAFGNTFSFGRKPITPVTNTVSSAVDLPSSGSLLLQLSNIGSLDDTTIQIRQFSIATGLTVKLAI